MRSFGKRLLNTVHGALIFRRRVEVLADSLAIAIPSDALRVLDLGCGDGQVARAIMRRRPELVIEGVDVLVRPVTHIPVTVYDGNRLPFADRQFDCVTIVDVLHHTDAPGLVLAEAARVASGSVVIKDHVREGILAGLALRLMDWAGNRGHDVRLNYNYLDANQWTELFASAALKETYRQAKLGLYGPPVSWAFERRLHFVNRLDHINRA
jgi:SAM-dependent methyltransferase